VGDVINALSLIEIFLFTLFSIVSPSFCIFALKYRLNSGAFYWNKHSVSAKFGMSQNLATSKDTHETNKYQRLRLRRLDLSS